jgi:hypothetical protein
MSFRHDLAVAGPYAQVISLRVPGFLVVFLETTSFRRPLTGLILAAALATGLGTHSRDRAFQRFRLRGCASE